MSTISFRTPAPQDWSVPWHVLAASSATGGQLVIGEARLPPLTSGPSFHLHTREDESAYVIEGMLTVAVGDDVFDATAGEFVWLPRDIPHTFANRSAEPVRVLGAIVPGGVDGMFAEQAEYFASLTGPPDVSVIAEIGARYGVSIVGPPLPAAP